MRSSPFVLLRPLDEPKNWLKIPSKPPPNKSSRLMLTPWKPPGPKGDEPGPLWPKVSYFLLSSLLESIANASWTSLNFFSASESSGFLSG